MNKKSDSVRIAGHIVFDPPRKTHQSALRIIMSTSFVKFLDERYQDAWNAMDQVSLNKSSLIKLLGDWQKTLRVAAEKSKEMNSMKMMYVRNMTKNRPEKPLEGCLQLQLVITFPWLSSHPKKLRARCRAVLKDKRPDVDNMTKIIMDSLHTARVIGDDGQISRLVVEKRHGEEPGVIWSVTELEREIPHKPKQEKLNPF